MSFPFHSSRGSHIKSTIAFGFGCFIRYSYFYYFCLSNRRYYCKFDSERRILSHRKFNDNVIIFQFSNWFWRVMAVRSQGKLFLKTRSSHYKYLLTFQVERRDTVTAISHLRCQGQVWFFLCSCYKPLNFMDFPYLEFLIRFSFPLIFIVQIGVNDQISYSISSYNTPFPRCEFL